jgi:hypothetical protein
MSFHMKSCTDLTLCDGVKVLWFIQKKRQAKTETVRAPLTYKRTEFKIKIYELITTLNLMLLY